MCNIPTLYRSTICTISSLYRSTISTISTLYRNTICNISSLYRSTICTISTLYRSTIFNISPLYRSRGCNICGDPRGPVRCISCANFIVHISSALAAMSAPPPPCLRVENCAVPRLTGSNLMFSLSVTRNERYLNAARAETTERSRAYGPLFWPDVKMTL